MATAIIMVAWEAFHAIKITVCPKKQLLLYIV